MSNLLVDGVNKTLAVSELALVYNVTSYQNAHVDVVMYFTDTDNLVPGDSDVSSRVVSSFLWICIYPYCFNIEIHPFAIRSLLHMQPIILLCPVSSKSKRHNCF